MTKACWREYPRVFLVRVFLASAAMASVVSVIALQVCRGGNERRC